MPKLTPEEELARLKVIKTETKDEATERISQELKDERKYNERRDFIMDFFFMLTGTPMTQEQFDLYNENYNAAVVEEDKTYNIKSFIRDIGIKIDHKVLESNFDQFLKDNDYDKEVKPNETN
jgi:hypothetical protein